MNNYLDLLNKVLTTGTLQQNRTGIAALVGRPAMLEFDLDKGHPAVTTKKLAFNSGKGELIGFLQAKTNAADFRKLGCNFWDQNANENEAWLANPNRIPGEGDLGVIYGFQWRKWAADDTWIKAPIDQVINALTAIRENPTDRGIIINAWRPDQFDCMSLRPCHVLYQFIVDVRRKELNLCMYQRSGDLFLGIPINISNCAIMLSFFAALTGLRPRYFTHFIAIPHLYENHIPQANVQLDRMPGKLPKLGMNIPLLGMASDAEIIASLTPEAFWLEDYTPYGPLPAPMAV